MSSDEVADAVSLKECDKPHLCYCVVRMGHNQHCLHAPAEIALSVGTLPSS